MIKICTHKKWFLLWSPQEALLGNNIFVDLLFIDFIIYTHLQNINVFVYMLLEL